MCAHGMRMKRRLQLSIRGQTGRSSRVSVTRVTGLCGLELFRPMVALAMERRNSTAQKKRNTVWFSR